MTELRNHFVYRIYDAAGQVLYIGCSKNLKQRWQTHRTENPAVVLDAARCKVQGPFPKAKALEVESAAITAERPLFNGPTFGGLPQAEAMRRQVIAGHKLGLRRAYHPASPAHKILVAAGLIKAKSA